MVTILIGRGTLEVRDPLSPARTGPVRAMHHRQRINVALLESLVEALGTTACPRPASMFARSRTSGAHASSRASG